MIRTKQELEFYLRCDRMALGRKGTKPSLFGDEIWKFQICMRKLDFYTTTGCILRLFYRFKYHNLSLKLGFSIPYDVFGPGLAIVHYGTIVISSGSKIGENCRIHAGVNIGANAGGTKAATIGNQVYIGPGAKIVGDITIGDNAVIGANAVVVEDVPAGVTVAAKTGTAQIGGNQPDNGVFVCCAADNASARTEH